jgi:hypothetical protein
MRVVHMQMAWWYLSGNRGGQVGGWGGGGMSCCGLTHGQQSSSRVLVSCECWKQTGGLLRAYATPRIAIAVEGTGGVEVRNNNISSHGARLAFVFVFFRFLGAMHPFNGQNNQLCLCICSKVSHCPWFVELCLLLAPQLPLSCTLHILYHFEHLQGFNARPGKPQGS